MPNLLSLLAIMAVLGLNSCGKDKDNSSLNCVTRWNSVLEDEYAALLTAANTYSTSQTVENCNKYKQAGQDYIDAMEDLEGCASMIPGQTKSFDEMIAEARADIDDLNCDQE